MITSIFDPETYRGVYLIYVFYYMFCLGGTLALLLLLRNVMPSDQGRAYAVNGELSKGKTRGVGLLFILAYVISSFLFLDFSWELTILLLLLLACMLTGYLDDAGSVPWGGLKKGLLDLGIALGAGFAAWKFYGTKVSFRLFTVESDYGLRLSGTLKLPAPIYIIIAAALVWGAINVVNCTDGVDGLCATLAIIALFMYSALGSKISSLGTGNNVLALGMIFCLIPYLWFNASPSSMLMGDAGSRSLGFLLAMLTLRSGCLLVFIPFCIVFILDGGLGLLKLALLRSVRIHILKNTRTPLHDHARKNLHWGDAQTVFRFALVQIAVILLYEALVYVAQTGGIPFQR
ncbi:MAG: phospho-N-acetylmuramoyl-pentapeptide-transferase [Lachnospiraceae bacterium]|nr:phospho-N-acetylmuramoyl-pentapeptide-transferase [Lachnospiraceae bacterium]